MRFRVTHLLAAMAIVAGLVAALSWPGASFGWVIMAAWFFYAALVCRVIATGGRVRTASACALVFGLSYLAVAYGCKWPLPPMTAARELWHNMHPTSTSTVMLPGGMKYQAIAGDYQAFKGIWHIAFSFGCAMLGGALGAYWSAPPKDKAEK